MILALFGNSMGDNDTDKPNFSVWGLFIVWPVSDGEQKRQFQVLFKEPQGSLLDSSA